MPPPSPRSSTPSSLISPPSGRHVFLPQLPERVENLIATICSKQNIDPPNYYARLKLSSLDEEKSINILDKMSRSKIGHFSNFLIYMVTKSPDARGLSNSPQTPEGKLVNSPRVTSPSQVTETRTRGVRRMIQTRLNFESPRKVTRIEEMNNYDDIVNSPRETSTLQAPTQGVDFESPVNAPINPVIVPNASRQMIALGELEFRRAYMILNYLNGAKLEEVVSVDFIKSLKCMNMDKFESQIWSKFGNQFIHEIDRIKHADWDSDKTHVYHCHVDLQGRQIFKGPYLENEKTHLQRVLGDENVLIVKFEEVAREENKSVHDFVQFEKYCLYHKLGEEGIMLGLRRYRFYVYKDGAAEESKNKNPSFSSSVKCYFVRTESAWEMDNININSKPYILSNLDFYKARLPFMHIHTISSLPKYMDRFSLILSKTIKLDIDLSTVNIKDIEDIECKDENGNVVKDSNGKPLIHTDGTGLISEDLAMLCPRDITTGKCPKSHDMQTEQDDIHKGSISLKRQRSDNRDPPLLMQVRLFHNGSAVKGTLLIDKRLPQRTICIRPSMIKVKRNRESTNIECFNSLEVVATSNKPKNARLSRYLIALLHYGGISEDFFLGLLEDALNDIRDGVYSSKGAIGAAFNNSGIDEDAIAVRMISCGIPLTEPYLQSRLYIMNEGERKCLKEGKIPITECYYLMGTVDPTGQLGPDEVCIILENGQVSGDVLVYKHPGLHIGDIHILKARYVREIERVVGNSKYAIFFPVVGPRSLADEMANSDYDGDMYWVSRNPELLKNFKQSEPWSPPKEETKKVEGPKDLLGVGEKKREQMLFGEFLKRRFKPSYAMSQSADFWMMYMDRFLTPGVHESGLENKINQLINIHYDALDARKTGKEIQIPVDLKVDNYPHFMGKAKSYNSTSILGKIYDRVQLFEYEKLQSTEVSKLPIFDEEIPLSCMQKWEYHYAEYLAEAREICFKNTPKEHKDKQFLDVFLKYKKILYEAIEFEHSSRYKQDIYDEALAIYKIVYSYAETRGVSKCGFVWKVAGHALCQLFIQKSGQSSLQFSLEKARQMLGR